MAREKKFKHVKKLDVHLWGHHMGAMTPDPRNGCYVFRYTPEFRRLGIEPSPLQMPTSKDDNWIFTELQRATYHGLPALVNDSLPDAFGNLLIDQHLPTLGIDRASISPLDRLAYLGERAMGALSFRPPQGPKTDKLAAIELRELVEDARRAIQGTSVDSTSTLSHIISVGISAGGARPKAVICWNPKLQVFRSGQFDAPEGFEHWLLKFDGIEDGRLRGPRNEGRIEYAYHLMAREAALDMTECRLHEEGGRAHFMTKRFDREGGSIRHHIQTLCAMAHMDLKYLGAYSYGQFYETIINLDLPEGSLEQAFRRCAFNVMARNLDDHSKNHSFRLREGGRWELSPAYDLTFAFNPNGAWNFQHFLAVNGKYDGITRADLLADAERYSVRSPAAILDQVAQAVSQWLEFSKAAGVEEDKALEIQKHHHLV
jgi:serine/threonine-protein kinase HipA